MYLVHCYGRQDRPLNARVPCNDATRRAEPLLPGIRRCGYDSAHGRSRHCWNRENPEFPPLDQMTQTVPPNLRPAAAAALRLPLEILPPGSNWLSPRAEAWWLWTFLAVGVALRLVRYLLRFPLWEDEAMLAANFLDRGYRELLQPLHYCQVAPPLFLWGQLTVVKLLGFTEWALRLVPFLCGVASLVLFRHVAGRLLSGTTLVLAVGIFAVSFPMTRYAAEAKPYGCDLLLAVAMLALAVEWLRRPGQSRWLWVLAAVVGPAIGYSFPAMFVAGGISLVTGYVLWKEIRERGKRGREPFPGNRRDDSPPLRSCLCSWLVYNLVLAASVVCLMIVSSRAVGEMNQRTMETVHWADCFPPLTHPLRLIGWFFSIHAGGMLGYPVGGPHWGSTFSFLCAAVGVVVLARRRQGLLLALLLAPLALNFVAAAMHRFPYGGHARMTLFLAPSFCTLISLGLGSGLAWFAARESKAQAEGRSRPVPGSPPERPCFCCWPRWLRPRCCAIWSSRTSRGRPCGPGNSPAGSGPICPNRASGPPWRPTSRWTLRGKAADRLVLLVLLQPADLLAAASAGRVAPLGSDLRRVPAAAAGLPIRRRGASVPRRGPPCPGALAGGDASPLRVGGPRPLPFPHLREMGPHGDDGRLHRGLQVHSTARATVRLTARRDDKLRLP